MTAERREIAKVRGEPTSAAVRTFLFVDMRGYTRYTVEHGDDAAKRLVEKFDDLTRKVLTAWHGEIVSTAGDEVLAAFGSAREALRAAVDLQSHIVDEARLDPTFPQVGIGLDTGEAISSGGTFIGASLNLAARLCKLAGPREVLVSESVVHVAGKLDELTYAERGFTQLKGFHEPVHLFQVLEARPGEGTTPSEGELLPEHPFKSSLPIGGFLGALPPTVLIAREPELRRVLAGADAALAGNGRLLLISGEPGVGKTRLAQEAMLSVRNRRFLVAAGRCYEQQQAVPFAPFLDVLSTLYATSPPSVRAMVATRWPNLGRLIPDAAPGQLPFTAATPEEQVRLFRAVAGFLEAIATEIPVAIFLDDLHVADGPSIELLSHIARGTRLCRILIVGTFRDKEVGSQHPLEALLRDLGREELVERIALHRLDSSETAQLIGCTLGDASVGPELARSVHQQTEGNPFFTQQLVRCLAERGDLVKTDGLWVRRPVGEVAVPESIRSITSHRVARLSERTQDLLRHAAVLGLAFRFDTLAVVSGLQEQAMEAGLEEARAAGLVAETQRDQFTFDHALTQQALYSELSARRRTRLHLAAAEAMEKLPEPVRTPLSSELAWHFQEAGQEARAGPYALAAGDHAASVFALREAERQYGVALTIARHVRDREGEMAALTQRAKLLLDTFQGKGAARDFELLLEAALQDRVPRLELVARLGLGGAYYVVALDEMEGDPISRGREMFEAAYDLAVTLGDKPSQVRALLGTRWFRDFWPEYRDRWRANAEEAVALSHEVGDPELILETDLATWREGPRSLAEERGARLVRELQRRNEPIRLNLLYFELMWANLAWGAYERAVDACDAGIRLAGELGIPPVQYPTLRALALIALGRYGDAWDSLQAEVVDADHPFGQAMQLLGVAEYRWELGDIEGTVRVSQELRDKAGRLHRAWMVRWADGLLARCRALTARQGPGAGRDAQEQARPPSVDLPPEVRGEVELTAGNAAAALREAERLREASERSGDLADCLGARLVEARADLDLGHFPEGVTAADEGLRLAAQCGSQSATWRLLGVRARGLRALGREEEARAAFLEAASVVHRLAGSIPDADDRARFLATPAVTAVLEGGT